ncbi:hypothetical protein HDR60_05785 [bacterium]|nr:hypothetical protein [bacterium]MDE6224287.1 hypothetical protein [Alphaproteobacteria bacterium]
MLKSGNLKLVIVAFVVIISTIIFFVSKSARGSEVEMILFYNPSCHHCHAAIEFLDNKVVPKYPELKITKHNTSTRVGANYYIYYKKKLKFDGNGVPVAVFGDKYEMGFGTEDTTGKTYIQNIEEMFKNLGENNQK